MRLLKTVATQSLYPNEILIIDGSPGNETQETLSQNQFQNLKYFKVAEEDRGLTRQRNFGVQKVSEKCEIICFLDDDIILSSSYFERLMETYKNFPEALGVSGYITNETEWQRTKPNEKQSSERFYLDGWNRTKGSRFSLRRRFGLEPDCPPGIMPEFSHGYSTGFLPPTGEVYEVEMLMGGIASYRISIFKKIRFSNHFEGYGLYEDADFSLRASKLGKLYVNTGAKLEHHHHPEGRPNHFEYGRMVMRNGWYVWREKFSKPRLGARVKWHATGLLLTFVRLGNVLTTSEKQAAASETLGRIVGWFGILVHPPKRKE